MVYIVLTRYITEPTQNGHTIELVMLYYAKAFSCYTQVNSGLACTITLTNVISILDAYNLQIPLFVLVE